MIDDYVIDFEEELKLFNKSLEVDEIGEAIVNRDITDINDIMLEILKQGNAK